MTYETDEARFMRACHALWAYGATGRPGNYIIAGLVGACGAFLIWQGVPGPWVYLLFAGVVLFVVMDLLRDRLWRGHYRNLKKYRAPITAAVGPEGVRVENANGLHSQPWSMFSSFARTDEFLFLIIDQRQFSVNPLDAFANPAEAATFESILVDHLKRQPRRHF